MTQAEFNQMLQTAIAGGAVGGYYTSKWSGEEIDKKLSGLPESGDVPASNPNLLDNWYFPDPINQRGKTSYSASNRRYSIDRWWTYGIGNLTVTSQGLMFSPTGARLTIAQNFNQNLVDLSIPVTLSVLYEKEGAFSLFSVHTVSSENTGYVTDGIAMLHYYGIQNADWGGAFAEIGFSAEATAVAAKLELGSEQTLAHQDASGSWVLNDPPPNKAQELAKCQQYQVQFVNPVNNSAGMVGVGSARSETQCIMLVPSPAPITRSGALAWSGRWVLYSGENYAWASGIPVTNMGAEISPSNGVCLYAYVASGLTVGKTYYLAYVPTSADTQNSLIYDMNL